MKYWNQGIECMPREKIKELQMNGIKVMLRRIYDNVPFYKKMFDDVGVLPEDIKTYEDFTKLPFTKKTDLRDTYPNGLLACSQDDIVRIHASSGTTGKPTVVMSTAGDLDRWSEMVARSLTMAGCQKSDVIQVSYGYGLFTGGLGLHYGVEKIGASVLPTSSGNTKRQINLMRDLNATTLCCTPSYALYLSEAAAEMGMTPETIPLKHGVFGAEPWSEGMRNELEKRLGIDALNIYGLSEIAGPGVAMECMYKNGMHVWEDQVLAEVINPETGEVLPDGSVGELVFTSFTKEGMPLLRYRTRDLTRLITEPCACGRTHARIDRVFGRSDDMLIIRGVNVFPSQIESVLLDMGEASPYYHLVVDREGSLDTLEVQVEVSDALMTGEIRGLEQLRSKLKKGIDDTLGIAVKLSLVEPKTLPRSEGKAVHVTDKRKI